MATAAAEDAGGRPGRRGEGRRPVLGEGSEAGGVWRLEEREERGERRGEERRGEATERESVEAEPTAQEAGDGAHQSVYYSARACLVPPLTVD